MEKPEVVILCGGKGSRLSEETGGSSHQAKGGRRAN
jgi:molybdopterin-guanine dinucleotide biosynthesis protein A